jgi:glycosyltransferase involved in cell wall biosynthesis
VRILVWHVHGSWMTAFVQGEHTYLIPVEPDRGQWGRGRADTWDWPPSAVEVSPGELAGADIDMVVLQRPEEIALTERWTGRRPGRDLPAVYVEHNTPKGDVPLTRHPVADRNDLTLVHVTAFNELFWDNGRAPVAVIEHGIPDPGHRYTGARPHQAMLVNEPVRRGRVTGTDLIPRFCELSPVELFGMVTDGLPAALGVRPDRLRVANLSQREAHERMAGCRVYVHPMRWTSLGLSLLEAMHLGMPVVALATTDAVEAVPAEAGVVSTRPDTLHAAVRGYLADHDAARAAGAAGRRAALARYGLRRFLDDWDRLIKEVTR